MITVFVKYYRKHFSPCRPSCLFIDNDNTFRKFYAKLHTVNREHLRALKVEKRTSWTNRLLQRSQDIGPRWSGRLLLVPLSWEGINMSSLHDIPPLGTPCGIINQFHGSPWKWPLLESDFYLPNKKITVVRWKIAHLVQKPLSVKDSGPEIGTALSSFVQKW